MIVISIHPWGDGLWVVTVGGEVVSEPMSLKRAQRARDYLRRNGVPWAA